MSEPVRIALVAEGPTDGVVIKTAIRSILGSGNFVLTQLQPEESVAFGQAGTGWVGVYRWCKQSAQRGTGQILRDAVLFHTYDIVVVHLDADVASCNYGQGAITPDAGDGDLPCACACPPASATCDALRQVLLTWCGLSSAPAKVVICMPSKNTETWVLTALFPGDPAVTAEIECLSNPGARLSQQPKHKRIKKSRRDYQSHESELAANWARLAAPQGLGEAARFQTELRAALPPSAV